MLLPVMHWVILIVDVERFSTRTDLHQHAVRRGLYDAMEAAFDEAGIDWQACVVEDRGDGAMILVPATFPKELVVDRLPGRLVIALRRHNAVSSAEASIKLRYAVHAGEVRKDDRGYSGTELNAAFRLAEAPELKAALAGSAGVLAMIVSNDVYRAVIRYDPGIAPGAYRKIPVSVKETDTTAWLRRFDDRPTVTRRPDPPPAPGSRAGPSADLFSLVDALLEVPAVRQESSRRMLIDLMRRDIAVSVANHHGDRMHVIALVRTCRDFEGGIAELVANVRKLGGDSEPVRRVAELAARLAGEA